MNFEQNILDLNVAPASGGDEALFATIASAHLEELSSQIQTKPRLKALQQTQAEKSDVSSGQPQQISEPLDVTDELLRELEMEESFQQKSVPREDETLETRPAKSKARGGLEEGYVLQGLAFVSSGAVSAILYWLLF